MVNYRRGVSSVTIGQNSSTAIRRVRQFINADEGKLVKPTYVGNTVGPVGVRQLHWCWGVEVTLLEEDETLIFVADLVGSNTTSVTTIAAGSTLNTTLVIQEEKTDGTHRTITYTSVYVDNWNTEESDTTGSEQDQPSTVSFISYGTRTVTSWS